MPIYEFRCNRCRRRSSVFVRSVSSPVRAVCSHCGSGEMSRLISRVAVLRPEEEAMAGMADMADVDENDPGSMARWVRRMSRQMGEPLDAEMETELERLEAGEVPEGVDEAGGNNETSVLEET